MPHIALIGRRSWKARLAFLIMYCILIVGGITMIVPFLIMVSSSFKSNLDSQMFDLVPGYWNRQDLLTIKYLEQQTNYDLEFYNGLARSNVAAMKDAVPPPPANAAECKDYYTFLRTLPPTFTILVNRGWQLDPRKYGTHPAVTDYRRLLFKKYGSQDNIEEQYSLAIPDIQALAPPAESWNLRWYQPKVDRRMADYLNFKKQQPISRLAPVPAESTWITSLRTKVNADVAGVNRALGTRYASLETAQLPLRYPANGSPALRTFWEACVRRDIPVWFVRADATAGDAWTRFLTARYMNIFAGYRKAHPATKYARFAEVPLPGETPLLDTNALGEWNDFISSSAFCPVGCLYLDTPEERYRAMLRRQYGSITKVNQAYGTHYANFASVMLPSVRVMAAEALLNARAIRWSFITRNYSAVTDYLVLHGRAFINTLVFIGLALLFTLTVNPMTAYALSRFKLKATNKLLLFLLATMAFPAEVAMIPSFLLLRDLHLLNTFWALVLPGVASGFSIFLLKGMFDGLPQDLYEAAELDGANEAVIFWRITMPLVKPFLAYLALGTFIGAYSAFAFAFLLCPNPKMWTIMVYLQQMWWASQPIQFAAFVLASVPTLIVFVTCQRIIMQGIVLPTER